jgi:hypothetical protein
MKYPSMVNIIGLVVGFLAATIFIISKIWGWALNGDRGGQMTDPSDAVPHFQQALLAGRIPLQRGTTHKDLFVAQDDGERSFAFELFEITRQDHIGAGSIRLDRALGRVALFSRRLCCAGTVPRARHRQGGVRRSVGRAVARIRPRWRGRVLRRSGRGRKQSRLATDM